MPPSPHLHRKPTPLSRSRLWLCKVWFFNFSDPAASRLLHNYHTQSQVLVCAWPKSGSIGWQRSSRWGYSLCAGVQSSYSRVPTWARSTEKKSTFYGVGTSKLHYYHKRSVRGGRFVIGRSFWIPDQVRSTTPVLGDVGWKGKRKRKEDTSFYYAAITTPSVGANSTE